MKARLLELENDIKSFVDTIKNTPHCETYETIGEALEVCQSYIDNGTPCAVIENEYGEYDVIY